MNQSFMFTLKITICKTHTGCIFLLATGSGCPIYFDLLKAKNALTEYKIIKNFLYK